MKIKIILKMFFISTDMMEKTNIDINKGNETIIDMPISVFPFNESDDKKLEIEIRIIKKGIKISCKERCRFECQEGLEIGKAFILIIICIICIIFLFFYFLWDTDL